MTLTEEQKKQRIKDNTYYLIYREAKNHPGSGIKSKAIQYWEAASLEEAIVLANQLDQTDPGFRHCYEAKERDRRRTSFHIRRSAPDVGAPKKEEGLKLSRNRYSPFFDRDLLERLVHVQVNHPDFQGLSNAKFMRKLVLLGLDLVEQGNPPATIPIPNDPERRVRQTHIYFRFGLPEKDQERVKAYWQGNWQRTIEILAATALEASSQLPHPKP
jgi:hypothetical protein